MAQEERIVGLAVERHGLHAPALGIVHGTYRECLAATTRPDDDLRVRASVHQVEVLSGDGEESELDEHVKRAHRAGVVVARKVQSLEERRDTRGPLRREVAASRVREEPRNQERRLVVEGDETVLQRIRDAALECVPAPTATDQAVHVVRDEKRILPAVRLVEVGVESTSGIGLREASVLAARTRKAAHATGRVEGGCVPYVRPVPRPREEFLRHLRVAQAAQHLRAAPVLICEIHRGGTRLHAPAVILALAARHVASLAVAFCASRPAAAKERRHARPVDAGDFLRPRLGDHAVRLVAALPHLVLLARRVAGVASAGAREAVGEGVDVPGERLRVDDRLEREVGAPGVPERVVVVPADSVRRAVARLDERLREDRVEMRALGVVDAFD